MHVVVVLHQINQPSYTTAVEQCINARNLFFSDSTCLNHYLIFDRRSSAIVVNSTATAICESQRCKNRMSAYINFLITCQRRSLEDDKDVHMLHTLQLRIQLQELMIVSKQKISQLQCTSYILLHPLVCVVVSS